MALAGGHWVAPVCMGKEALLPTMSKAPMTIRLHVLKMSLSSPGKSYLATC